MAKMYDFPAARSTWLPPARGYENVLLKYICQVDQEETQTEETERKMMILKWWKKTGGFISQAETEVRLVTKISINPEKPTDLSVETECSNCGMKKEQKIRDVRYYEVTEETI